MDTPSRKLAIFVLVLGVSISASPLALASCEGLGKYGIYDIRSTANDTERTDSFQSWFCQHNFQSYSDANTAGGSLGFKELNIGYNQTTNNWREFKSSYCSQQTFNSKFRDKTTMFIQTINNGVIDLMKQCLTKQGVHARIEQGSSPQKFRFYTTYTRPLEEKAPTYQKVDSFIVKGGTCRPMLRKGDKIGTHGKELSCTRNNNQGVDITLNTTSEVIKDTPLSLPPLVTQLPQPPQEPWQLIKGDCVNVQFQGWQTLVSHASAPTQIVLKGWWFYHLPTGLTNGNNQPIKILNDQGEVVREFPNDELPFEIKIGESASFRISDTEYQDNDIPWAHNTKPGYPPLRYLVKQRMKTPPSAPVHSNPLCIQD